MRRSLVPTLLAVAVTMAACTESPTGRNQLILLPSDQMASLGEEAFTQIKQEEQVSDDPAANAYVDCVAQNILEVQETDFAEWEVAVFESDQANAFALPGGKIGIYTGMLQVATEQDMLAAVMAHEVGHVQAQHGAERVSQNLLVEGGLAAVDQLFDGGETESIVLGALGLGAQYGVLLPYSRDQESEADFIGLDLMARAGFDPQGAVQLWQRMQELSSGAPPEFLSTHPSPETRIEELQARMAEAEQIYQEALAAGRNPDCPVSTTAAR